MGYLNFRKPDAVAVSDSDKERANKSGLKISLLAPTRGRPENVERLLRSLADTSAQMPEVVFYVDRDDPALGKLDDMRFGDSVKWVDGPRITLSQCWNKAYEHATGDILMHAGDDIVFKTPGWDAMVVNAYADHPDKLIFVHGDDGYWGSKFGTHGFLHRRWVEVVGYFVPPHYASDYNDTHLNEVANLLNRRVFLPFVTEHMHPLFGKAEWDLTHRERLERHKIESCDELYKTKAWERERDAKLLRAVIDKVPVTA